MFKKGGVPHNKGKIGVYKTPKEVKLKISKSVTGHPVLPETREKIRLALKGRLRSKEHSEKISKANSGANNHFWNGGISFEPYSIDFNNSLKKTVRIRDKYTCRICGKEPSVIVHHIDYNKKNCELKNLITLCGSCHAKTNHNRKKWIEYLTTITASN